MSKIYIQAAVHGKGFGRKAIQFLENLACTLRLNKISLTVNKNDVKTIKAYEKMGFNKLGPVVQDIGNGFIMDDFKIEKKCLICITQEGETWFRMIWQD